MTFRAIKALRGHLTNIIQKHETQAMHKSPTAWVAGETAEKALSDQPHAVTNVHHGNVATYTSVKRVLYNMCYILV